VVILRQLKYIKTKISIAILVMGCHIEVSVFSVKNARLKGMNERMNE
jgi:hypothetical protein